MNQDVSWYETEISKMVARMAELEAHCDSMEEIATDAGVGLFRAEEHIAELEGEAKTRDKFLSEAWEDIERLKAGLVKERELAEAIINQAKKVPVMYRPFDLDDAICTYRKARGL